MDSEPGARAVRVPCAACDHAAFDGDVCATSMLSPVVQAVQLHAMSTALPSPHAVAKAKAATPKQCNALLFMQAATTHELRT